jgi:hypothetical protein
MGRFRMWRRHTGLQSASIRSVWRKKPASRQVASRRDQVVSRKTFQRCCRVTSHVRSREVIPAQTPLTSWIAEPVSTACQANGPTGA